MHIYHGYFSHMKNNSMTQKMALIRIAFCEIDSFLLAFNV